MFTHLHVHTEYSLLDGMCRVPALVERAKELGMEAVAITDHGAMYGAIQFYQAAREAGIKPIIGCEVYLAPHGRLGRDAADKSAYHLVLLARNQTGYRNLIQLATRAQLEGFYYKPRVDKDLLKEHHQGLVALSSCASGEIARFILEGRQAEARQAALWYKEVFGDFYLEVQRFPMPEVERINQDLIAMGRELGVPLVATNDVHYLHQADAATHDLLLCIGTNSTVNDEKRMKMSGDFFYLRSAAEMEALYRDIPEAIENTGRIAEMCNLKLEFGRLHLPEIELPVGKTADDFLADLCREGLPHHYPSPTDELRQRLEYELNVIRKTEFANYFLVVWDIISFTRQHGILFGVRGSAAASLVLHCLGITEIDPMQNQLVFERFLNVERKEMPDIDLDFQDDRRDEVIAYVSKKYGQDHVAQIITFGTLGARAALRDVGRALGMTYADVDRVARLVPYAPNMTLQRAMEENPELKSIYQDDAIVRKLIESARRVEGIARHASTHAAGMVISREPLTRHIPLQRVARGAEEGSVMTQFTMEDIARIGLLKMDLLGLANLTILVKAREMIRQARGTEIDLHRLPMDDKQTFALLSAGETAGVFQLEGAGMRRYIKELKPTNFSDIVAMIALYRPGPMEHIPTFIQGKHDPPSIQYVHAALESILKETYGVIVYQEQVLFIVQALAGYSLGQADIFRKAMGKKIAAVMQKEKLNFMAGAEKRGFSPEVASQVFALIEPFAGYAFNKAHATSYALIAYQTAYLKANYPAEYMTALLISHTGQLEKVANAIAECHRLGLRVLPPDINHSHPDFAIEQDGQEAPAIRFGLAAIKNVGAGAVEPILAEREKGGAFRSIEDLCRRCDFRGLNKRALESLIKAGAFDCLGDRATLLNSTDRILALGQREQKRRETGQSTMFDLWGQAASVPLPSLELVPAEASTRDRLAWEKELTGVYLSEHPFSALAGSSETTLCGQIDRELEGQTVSVAGMVSSARVLSTRDKRPFASVRLEDLSGEIEVMVWPKVYANTHDLWQEGNLLLVEGKVREREGRLQVSCESVRTYQPPSETQPLPEVVPEPAPTPLAPLAPPPSPTLPGRRRLCITVTQGSEEVADLARLNSIVATLREFPGAVEVNLRLVSGGTTTSLRLPDAHVEYSPELEKRLARLVGPGELSLEAAG